jgi:hypothetical protein
MTELYRFTFVAAYHLSVYASLWLLPSTSQDSIQRFTSVYVDNFGGVSQQHYLLLAGPSLLGAHSTNFNAFFVVMSINMLSQITNHSAEDSG